MRRFIPTVLALCFAVTIYAQTTSTAPRGFLLDAKQLQENKLLIQKNDPRLAPAMSKLEQDAKKALKSETYSVTRKGVTPPSGDKHDYMSQAPYFWPDPKSPNGLPYIRRDGERNPEINKITDHHTLDQMIGAVETLALTYYFKGDEAYVAKAAQLLRAWFLDEATRMNPNLEYAQYVPGVNTGRGIGLIETHGLTRVVDALGLLAGAKAWTVADQRGVQAWFTNFLQWMQESKNGQAEAAAKNNHGTIYDVQIVSYALLVGKRELATEVLKTAQKKRIAFQIEPDGRQPLELARTKTWSYSRMNLNGMMQLARLGENVGVDLWHFHTTDGRRLQRALDYLTPYALGEKKWPHDQLGEWEPNTLYPLMQLAAKKFEDKKYREWLTKIPTAADSDRSRLLMQVSDKN